MPKKNDPGHEHDDEHEGEQEEEGLGGEMPIGMELEAASQVVLEMREQNVELLKIAVQVAGYAGSHGPLKPGEIRQAMSAIWDVYSQLHQWIEPEESEGEGEDDEEEE